MHYYKACAYGLMGQAQPACQWLEKAITLDESLRENAQTDTDFDAIRHEPTFESLVGKGKEDRPGLDN